MIIFPGNHDCQTIKGWYKSLNLKKRKILRRFLNNNKCSKNINIGIIQYCLKCNANITIVQAQDILELGNYARTNTPGTISNKNWSWKLKNLDDFKLKINNINPIILKNNLF